MANKKAKQKPVVKQPVPINVAGQEMLRIPQSVSKLKRALRDATEDLLFAVDNFNMLFIRLNQEYAGRGPFMQLVGRHYDGTVSYFHGNLSKFGPYVTRGYEPKRPTDGA